MEIDDLDQLRLDLMKQLRAARAGLNEEFLDLDERFHLRIADGAQLPILRAFLGQLGGFVRVATLGAKRPPEVLRQIVGEHERIVDAIEARDAGAAVAALEDHLSRADYPSGRVRDEALR
jgi:DNA-binding GntR family transcriptional regulator